MNNFVEITSNDNWFKKHPEKIAGVEFETTSFFFPIQVKGTKEDVLRVTGMSDLRVDEHKSEHVHNPEINKLNLAKAKMKMAKAKLILIGL